jgi:hypothetical protein
MNPQEPCEPCLQRRPGRLSQLEKPNCSTCGPNSSGVAMDGPQASNAHRSSGTCSSRRAQKPSTSANTRTAPSSPGGAAQQRSEAAGQPGKQPVCRSSTRRGEEQGSRLPDEPPFGGSHDVSQWGTSPVWQRRAQARQREHRECDQGDVTVDPYARLTISRIWAVELLLARVGEARAGPQ